LKPDNPSIYNNLGVALIKKGKLDDALSSFREAAKQQPDHSGANNNLALALKRKGMNGEATHHFREAAHINPAYRSSLP
jgi:Flp pilus assembly protein TadD